MMCQAKVERLKTWNVRGRPRVIDPRQDPACKHKATTRVGPLQLCTVHARLAREGFVAKNGSVESSLTIRDCRRYGIKPPNDWAKGSR